MDNFILEFVTKNFSKVETFNSFGVAYITGYIHEKEYTISKNKNYVLTTQKSDYDIPECLLADISTDELFNALLNIKDKKCIISNEKANISNNLFKQKPINNVFEEIIT